MKFLKPALNSALALALIVVATLSAAAPKPGKIALVDRIVAVVNNEVITQRELDEKAKLAEQQLQRQGTPLPSRDVLEKQLLERLIIDKVQLQYAKENGVTVDDEALEQTLQRIATENKLTMEQFRAVLKRDGVSYDKFREDIRNEMVLARLREREVDNKIFVSDADVDNYLANRQRQGEETEYNAAQIFIRVPEQATPEQLQAVKAKADKAWQQLKNGADFRQVSASVSDAPNAIQGGPLGWGSASRIPPLFVEALDKLQPGDITPVLRSPNGFHILKLVDKRGKNVKVVVPQTHVQHILIKTNEVVSETDAKQRLLQLKERLDNGADFSELARLHSGDASASKGGDLGWISPGDTVPEFEQAMNALKIGQVSEPVKSPFGWHLIKVLERRSEDMGDQRARVTARQEIRERKADEAYQEWLRQLRDRAYVEYRNDE